MQWLAEIGSATSSGSAANMVCRDLQKVTAKVEELQLCVHDLQDQVEDLRKDNAQVCMPACGGDACADPKCVPEAHIPYTYIFLDCGSCLHPLTRLGRRWICHLGCKDYGISVPAKLQCCWHSGLS